jgi:hypothetical protein
MNGQTDRTLGQLAHIISNLKYGPRSSCAPHRSLPACEISTGTLVDGREIDLTMNDRPAICDFAINGSRALRPYRTVSLPEQCTSPCAVAA